MYMAEAPGMDKILNLVVFGLLVSKMNNTVTCKGNMYCSLLKSDFLMCLLWI